MGVSWRDRGSCGASASNRFIAVLSIALIQPRRDGRDGVLSVVSGWQLMAWLTLTQGKVGKENVTASILDPQSRKLLGTPKY